MPTVPLARQVAPSAVSTPLNSGRGASLAAFGGGIAQATGGLAESIQSSSNVLEQIQFRRMGQAREADDTAFTSAASQMFRQMQEVDDFSEVAVNDAKANVKKLYDDLIKNHKGGTESREMLRQRLNERMVAFNDDLAIQNISYENKLLDIDSNQAVNKVVAAVTEDPNIVTSSLNPKEVLEPHFAQMIEQFAFMGLSPMQIAERLPMAQETIAAAAFDPLIANGQFDRAREFLKEDGLKELLSPATRRQMIDRVERGERALKQANNNGGEGAKLHFVTRDDGSILGLNPSTGEVVAAINGPPIESMEDIGNVFTLRKEYSTASDTFLIKKYAYRDFRANAVLPEGAGQLAAITNYIKLTDPTSIVRQSDVETGKALTDTSLSAQAKSVIQQYLSNDGFLTPDQMTKLSASAHATYMSSVTDQENTRRQHVDFALSRKWDPDEVDFALPDHTVDFRDLDPLVFESKGGTPSLAERVRETAKEAVGIVTGTPSPEPAQPPPAETVNLGTGERISADNPPASLSDALEEFRTVVEETLPSLPEILPSLEELQALPADEAMNLLSQLFPDGDVMELEQFPELLEFFQEKAKEYKKGKSK